MPYSRLPDLLAVLPLSMASNVQSALHPGGEHAARIADMTWILFVGGAVIFVWVLVMLILALYGSAGVQSVLARRAMIVGGGIAFPVVVLSALLVYTLRESALLAEAGTPPTALIEINGEMWWWRVRYLDADGRVQFETANEIRIPSGAPVDLVLKSDNVIHSFWVPNLAGKLDMVPGHVNRLRIQATEPGVFRGQCAEYCGAQHANMMIDVQALAPADFDAWVATQRTTAREPDDARLRLGQQYFMRLCAECHVIRGTEATGTLGPDLTHVGGRMTLAAGVLPNGVGALAGWIAGSQHIKPGNAMPSFNQLSGEGLRAVAQYLESLQ